MLSPLNIAVLPWFYPLYIAKMENYAEKLPRYIRHEAEQKKAELLKSVEDYKECLKILEGIKRVHKKDGGDFANVFKNFDMPGVARFGWWHCVYSKYWEIYDYPHRIQLNYHDRQDKPTADELEAEIKEHAEKYRRRIAEAENSAKRFDGELDELASLGEKIGEFLDNLKSENDYKMRDILKKAL